MIKLTIIDDMILQGVRVLPGSTVLVIPGRAHDWVKRGKAKYADKPKSKKPARRAAVDSGETDPAGDESGGDGS